MNKNKIATIKKAKMHITPKYNYLQCSHLYLKLLSKQITFYENQINHLKEHKPFFFQKRKLQKHNNKIKEYEDKINVIYDKMGEEIDFIIDSYEE